MKFTLSKTLPRLRLAGREKDGTLCDSRQFDAIEHHYHINDETGRRVTTAGGRFIGQRYEPASEEKQMLTEIQQALGSTFDVRAYAVDSKHVRFEAVIVCKAVTPELPQEIQL